MKNKRSNPLLTTLYFSLALLFVIMPTILVILEREFVGLAFPMGVIGLWLILVGRIKLGGLTLEGNQAFSVGGALLFPYLISATVHQLGLWPPISIGAVAIGLIVSPILYFAIKPTSVSKDRTPAIIIFLCGLGLIIVGNSLDTPSDASGVILVNGIPLLPVPSMIFFMIILGIGAIVVGLYGLIFGFSQRKR